MTGTVELACRCGQVRGRLTAASPRTVNRAVCYCDDCQAALHHLGRTELLDEHGGTDVVQVAPARLTFESGTEQIRGLRLTPKGLYRWHAGCCKSPLGNTLGPGIPFVGVQVDGFRSATQDPDALFGPPRGRVMEKFAIGSPQVSIGSNLSMLAHVLRLILGWKLGGKTWPHPFFEHATRAPRYPLIILSRDQREALRALCGPRPASPVPS